MHWIHLIHGITPLRAFTVGLANAKYKHILALRPWLSKSRSRSYDPTILRSHLPKTI